MTELATIPIASIPLVVALWERPNFGGRKRTFIEAALDPGPYPGDPSRSDPDLFDLTSCNFNDATNAIGIHPGPNFDPNEQRTVSFFADAYFQGDELCLAPGAYGDLLPFRNFGGKISSIRFNPPFPNPKYRKPGYYQWGNLLDPYPTPNPAATIAPIPLVVRLFADGISNVDPVSGYPVVAPANLNYLTLVESALDINAMFGPGYDKATSGVIVQKGPNFSPTFKARLYANILTPGENWEGIPHVDIFPDQDTEPTWYATISVAHGVYPALPHNFDKGIRAVSFFQLLYHHRP